MRQPPRAAGCGLPALALVGLLLPACETAEKDKKPPATNVPAPAADPSSTPTARPAAARPSLHGLIDVAAEEVHVARLVLNEPLSQMSPSEYCLDDGKLWKGARFRLGRVNVFGVDQELAVAKGRTRGGPVAVFGRKKQNLASRLTEAGPCPEDHEPVQVQMRSDWVAPEGGPNTTREQLEKLSYIEGQRVQAVHMVEFLDSDEKVVRLRLRNPFTQSLAPLAFQAHYEGGGGKPMPTMVTKVLALEPGQWTELSLPRRLAGEQPRTKAGSGLHSLELGGQLGKAEVEIEIFVPHL